MDVLLFKCLDRRLRFDALALVVLSHDNRALDDAKYIADLALGRLGQSGPFGLDGALGDLSHAGLQIRKALAVRIAAVAAILVVGALSLGRHCRET